MARRRVTTSAEAGEHPSAVQLAGVMGDGLEAQHALALRIGLEGQLAEVELEHRQSVHRSARELRSDARLAVAAASGVAAFAEDGPDLAQVEMAAVAVQQVLEDLLHLVAAFEEQVAAVLDLEDGVVVAEAGALLVGEVQAEDEAGRVDPALDDLAQAPCGRRVGQGVCDPREGRRVGHGGEAVALFAEADPRGLRGAGDMLVPVEHDLRAEGWVPRHLDGEMPEMRVPDVERVVVDGGPLLCDLVDHPLRRAAHLVHRSWRAGHQDEEDPGPRPVRGEVLLCELVLAHAARALDDRHAIGLGPRSHPAGAAAGQTHEVGVVEHGLGAELAPPEAEARRRMAQRAVRGEDDAVDTVVAAGEQITVAVDGWGGIVRGNVRVQNGCGSGHSGPPVASSGAEGYACPLLFFTSEVRRGGRAVPGRAAPSFTRDCPEGAIGPERSLGTEVGLLSPANLKTFDRFHATRQTSLARSSM